MSSVWKNVHFAILVSPSYGDVGLALGREIIGQNQVWKPLTRKMVLKLGAYMFIKGEGAAGKEDGAEEGTMVMCG